MTSSAQQDESAVAAVRRGDAERYRELVERHERRVFAVAWSRLGDAALAEEAAQEAFIRGYRRLWLLGDGAKFAAWITTIARHAAINLGLRHRRELNKRERWAMESANDPAGENSATETDPLHTPETLRQTLAELPAAHRECLVLYYLEGRSGAEAAATLGISEVALRVRLHRARAALRERLEEKLEGSLANLRPAKTLVSAVMAAVLVSSSAQAAAGGTVAVGIGAKLVSVLGKTFVFSWFLPLVMLLANLPGLAVASVIMRKERENFRDAGGFRPQLHRQFFKSFIWGFPLVIVLVAVMNQSALAAWGIKGSQLFLGCFLVLITLIASRAVFFFCHPQAINSFVYCCIITVGTIAFDLGRLPPSLVSLPLLLATVWFFFTFKRPMRMDYSLFLRAAHGQLKISGGINDAPTANHLDRRALKSFASFLGAHLLVGNFRWDTNGLVLRLPPVASRFLTGMASTFMPPISQNCSHISLGWNGTVSAHCGKTDLKDLSALKTGKLADPRELESVVAEVVNQAWQEFRTGNIAAAKQTLGDSPESEVFVVPPARSKSMRWWRIWIGISVVLMTVTMVAQLLLPNHSQSSFRLKPVELTEAQVRYSLEQKAGFTNFDEAIKFGDNLTPVNNLVLPPANLMNAETMEKMRALFLKNFKLGESNSSARVELLLNPYGLQKAFVNGWFTKEQIGVTDEIIRQTVTNASKFQKQQWFQLQPIPTVTSEFKNGKLEHHPVDYTVLEVDRLALTLQCLDKLGCLDAMRDKSVAETLLHHQILTDQTPPGRRPIADAKSLHGLFYTMGYDPILDTYESLVVLEKLGRLDQVNQAACVDGILRFHQGGGLFASPNKDDGLVIFGDAHDTIAAFESLRILGALNRMKDLDKWKFRPNFTSRMPDGIKERVATWDEIEAWVCQQRLQTTLRERKENPTAPVRSLLEP